MSSTLGAAIELPCGLTLPNRLVKAAMAEAMADDSNPGDKFIAAYTSWGSGEWGAILTGNVEVSSIYRGSNNSVAVMPSISPTTRDAWTRWALASQRNGTPAIVQIVHPGRQSPAKAGNRGFFDKSIAPSAIPLKLGDGILDRVLSRTIFGTPREMTLKEIAEVVDQFTVTAKLAYESGFKGIQIHGAHGYLISQFLSSKMNVRTDAYGGTAAKRAQILIDIIRAIRKEVPPSFCVSIKLNSADVAGSENLEESLEQIGLISREQVDFLEISGGSYENPRMAQGDNLPSIRSVQREAFFLDYARAVRERYPNIILMVTGGFRSRIGMVAALESNSCDLIGLARPAAVLPSFPKDMLLNEGVKDEDAAIDLTPVKGNWLIRMLPIKILGTGVDTMYYVKQIHKMGVGQKPQPPPKV
ncbi:NADH:flavin oxidoreductase/NADH oxidase-like protein [Lindgomyces ingoldianus]|uniref:NADH:flavin oxidoreductase/NADH oxidase-like protein n=1 Tax=Lindgomyces ingoldianus TaxID=673940 RepID=A0ACB6QPM7_9PLEO|nr:NADH:flavin oxidoreductase/NADH oxidase-like protein [Lindgomyces ingoldianus]KAF2468052.1 NADH:flavin oxidoreductase/NADH oxidase-like protein [Lindgomyces ingoldianus]